MLETILQHTQGKNPAGFDYAFNLGYGQRYTAADPSLAALRTRLDEETARRAKDPQAARLVSPTRVAIVGLALILIGAAGSRGDPREPGTA